MYRIHGLGSPATLTNIVLLGVATARSVGAAALDWQAPENCPTREVLERRIGDAIGIPLENAADIRFTCEVTQAKSGSYRLALRVEVPGASGGVIPRIIEAPSCDQVAESAAIAITLALGADAAALPAVPDVAAKEQPKEAAETQANSQEMSVPVPTPKQPAQSSLSPLWAAAHVGPIFDLGSLPGISPGLELTGKFGYRSVSARLSGSAFGERQVTHADGAGGVFSLLAAALALCGNTARERAYGTLCAGVELGRMRGKGQGSGVSVPREGASNWATPRVDVELTSAAWLFGMRGFVGATAGLPLVRRPFTLGGNDVVQQGRPDAARSFDPYQPSRS